MGEGRRYTCIESQADIKRKRSKRLIVGNNKTKKRKVKKRKRKKERETFSNTHANIAKNSRREDLTYNKL